MNLFLISAISFTVILGMVLGAPVLNCDKIQGQSFTNRYKVTLEDPRDAEDVIELVEKYQNMADSSEIVSKLEPFGNELKGSLSKQALLLVCMDNRIQSIEHEVGIYPSPGDEEESEPVDPAVGVYLFPGYEEEGKPVDSAVGINPLPGDEEESIDSKVEIFLGNGSGEESFHCSLPGNSDDEYETYRFTYNDEADVNEVAQKLIKDEIQLATVVPGEHNIIFTINRTTYYEACKDSAIQCVEYYSSTNTASNSDGEAWEEDSVENSASLFSIEIKSPTPLEKRQARCEKLNQRLQDRVNNVDGFWVLTSERSCETSMDDVVTLRVWLNRRSYQYVHKKGGLHITRVGARRKTC